MEVTLSQVMELVPEMAQILREDIRAGRLPAERRTGMAGRPYVISSETLAQSDREIYRQLAKRLEQSFGPKARMRGRDADRFSDASARADGIEAWYPLIKVMESQHEMMRETVGLLSQEMSRRNERIARQTEEIQQLSYKLGQAYQEINRLERELGGNPNLARAE